MSFLSLLSNASGPLNLLLQIWNLKLFPWLFYLLHIGFLLAICPFVQLRWWKVLNITRVKFLSKFLLKRGCVVLGAIHIPWSKNFRPNDGSPIGRCLVKVVKCSFLTYSMIFSMSICILDANLWLGSSTSS